MLDSHTTDLEEMRDPLLSRKVPHLLHLLRGLDILRGRVMIRHEHDPVPVEDALRADLLELHDRNRRRDVVSEREIELRRYQLARLDALL